MNGTSRRTKKALVIAAIAAMTGAGTLAAAGPAAADHHAGVVRLAHPVGDNADAPGDDHGTGGRDDHGTGGGDDHGTGGRDDHGTLWAGSAATR
ncbi:hypothetical protein [Streptomyces hiroshimensis]|uniref:Uncharacterized protein n=1 Tax=Streptomyces hiroshimensis TaxID=66424 RepID=A0ABQ2YAX4_9ACTN|nr:hypothetical protein [Streptomyces hiroshimensis]GGX78435.1 hypothetical protein GCM10010324_24990 [Streptomyces hiroshimensis]